jgi:DNA-binding response OmpR family regulator
MKAAVLEDDAPQSALVIDVLRQAGHSGVAFASGRDLITKLRQETFDLLILDWNVRHVSGLEVAAWVREHLKPPPPILMITARASAEDLVAGLNAGADDFIVKPVDPPVLTARVNALLRRAYPAGTAAQTETFGPFVFDPFRLVATRGDTETQLTAKEFALAVTFFRSLNRPLGRAYLLETVWGRNPDLATRTLDSHVSKIRNKLDLRPETGFKLAPVYSYGYRLEATTEGEGGGG